MIELSAVLYYSTLDEIVLNYIATVLESLAEESVDLRDTFDAEEFCEMLAAYFPGFESIPHSVVTQWICDLVASIRKEAESSKLNTSHNFLFDWAGSLITHFNFR